MHFYLEAATGCFMTSGGGGVAPDSLRANKIFSNENGYSMPFFICVDMHLLIYMKEILVPIIRRQISYILKKKEQLLRS